MPRIEQIDDDRPHRLDPGWHPNSESRPLTKKQRNLCESYAEEYPHLFAVAHRLYPGACQFLMRRGFTSDDIHSIAWLGVIRASKRYKPINGAKFSTYATYHVRAALSRQIADIGRKKRTLPEGFEVYSAHELPSGDDEWETIVDCRASARAEETERRDELSHLASRSLSCLSDMQRRVVELRYGLAGEPPLWMKDIGKRLGITRGAANQVLATSFAKIRETVKFQELQKGRAA